MGRFVPSMVSGAKPGGSAASNHWPDAVTASGEFTYHSAKSHPFRHARSRIHA